MRVLGGLVGIAYPFLIYFGLRWLEPRYFAGIVAIAIGLRGFIFLRKRVLHRYMNGDSYADPFPLGNLAFPVAVLAAAIAAAAISNEGVYFLFTPVIINTGLLLAFSRTLVRGPSMIELFARMQVSNLSDDELRYCRRVTILWCCFFVINGSVALWLALFAPLVAWTFYNGFLSYLLMGGLFFSEFVYRKWRFRRYEGAPTDAVFRRIFPPHEPRG